MECRRVSPTAEGRSGRLRCPKTTGDRLGSPGDQRSSLARREVDGDTRREGPASHPDLDLRGSPRLLGPRGRGGQPLPDLPGIGRAPDPLREGDGLHAYRDAADHGESLRRFMGLPAGLAVRADEPLRDAGRFRRFRGCGPRGRNRCDAGLGARSLSSRRPRPWPVRWNPPLRTRRPRQGFHQDWGTYIYNFGRTEVSASSPPMRGSGSNIITSTACAWMPSRRCSTSTTRVVRANGSRNRYGGNENLDAIEFLRKTNEATYAHAPGTLTVAEESTVLAGRLAPDLHGWPWLRLQVEHGVDARHPELCLERIDPPAIPSPRPDLRSALRVFGKLHPTPVP